MRVLNQIKWPVIVADSYGLTKLQQIEYIPDIRTGFIYFNGQLREIRDVHETNNGMQIELYPRTDVY